MSLNINNLRLVRDDIARAGPEHFDMSIFFDIRDCGTVACVAGFATLRARGLQIHDTREALCWGPKLEAELFLGLTDAQPLDLFYAFSIHGWPSHGDTLRHLDSMIDHGVFRRWSDTFPERAYEQ